MLIYIYRPGVFGRAEPAFVPGLGLRHLALEGVPSPGAAAGASAAAPERLPERRDPRAHAPRPRPALAIAARPRAAAARRAHARPALSGHPDLQKGDRGVAAAPARGAEERALSAGFGVGVGVGFRGGSCRRELEAATWRECRKFGVELVYE
ncbi:hypothetical protein GSI_12351 [Ganoderma sinense ZZ0214-1]|uniref:Uncharacterized protein n=1 Tax=Ganoderma sinense ZZ0214-1 TaxID=1077348 RepID=A0A2G8RYJ6_9APHY|nr:hypothetical protein GSI_12351 [Ganoderma sinense ZZ0214-1]